MMMKNCYKCHKCLAGLTAALTVGIWYVVGYLAVMYLTPETIMRMPQITFALALGGEDVSVWMGLLQVFIATFIVFWLAACIHSLLVRRCKFDSCPVEGCHKH